GPRAERVRRRRARRARPASQDPPGALTMARYVVRRLIGMVVVLFAISVLTFVIFNVIPNGDPAERLAGHNASPLQIEAIRRQWGLDRSKPVQYVKTMENVFNGSLISYSPHVNVIDQI